MEAHMHKIADLGAAIARIENLDSEAAARREKELRNLTQRLPFMPIAREGRTDVYEFASLAALRLVQIAADVGLSRPTLAKLVSALHEPDRAGPPEAGMKGRVMDRLLAQAQAGERFTVSVDLLPGGKTVVRTGETRSPEIDAVFEAAGIPDPVARVEIQADELIRGLLEELGGD